MREEGCRKSHGMWVKLPTPSGPPDAEVVVVVDEVEADGDEDEDGEVISRPYTLQPCSCKARLTARPMPAELPVTTAFFPARSSRRIILFGRVFAHADTAKT